MVNGNSKTGGDTMMTSRFLLNFLSSREPFWYWKLHNIKIGDHYLEFQCMAEGNETTYRIEIGHNGFTVKLFQPALIKKRKLVKTYKNVEPIDLEDVISHAVFHCEPQAA